MTTPYVDPQSIHNPSTGTSPPAAWGDAVRDGLEYLARAPGCSVRKSAQNVNATTWTAVRWDATDVRDTDGYHDPASNNSRITIPTGLGGRYYVHGTIAFASNSTGVRMARYRLNGGGDFRLQNLNALGSALGTVLGFSFEVDLAAGDYFELEVWQNSGGTLSITTGCTLDARVVAL